MTLESARREFPHLDAYLRNLGPSEIEPLYLETLTQDNLKDAQEVLYPLEAPLFVHIKRHEDRAEYLVVQPPLDEAEQRLLVAIKDAIFNEALHRAPPRNAQELERVLLELFPGAYASRSDAEGLAPDPTRSERVLYFLVRDVVHYGPLEPFMKDPYLEDIQAVGAGRIHAVHKFFDMLASNVRFPSLDAIDAYLRNLSERIGRPVSDSRPIVDGSLFDGSRINIVYSNDVSRKGPSFSIRRVHAQPVSVTQLIRWRTLSAEIAAYVWLCLENGMSLFVCGEAASGKSATLNAFLCFINQRSKIYSAEDTPEVRPPHAVWQRLLTRDTGAEEARVRMFDLLRAALRSRPNYIVVGEIRGAEGAVAFQAMQTGHPTVATFHATDKIKMIQRLGAAPINIPATFMDNLNVALFQQAMYRDGRLIRRVTAVDEIQGFDPRAGGVVTLPVFGYDPFGDRHVFRGKNNSFILERKIAEQHGYEDPSTIYEVLDERTRVLQGLADHGVLGFDQVNKAIFEYVERGASTLPFRLEGNA